MGMILGAFNIKYMSCIYVKGQVLTGLILISPEKLIIEKSLRLGFSATNNEAEYEVLFEGMSMVHRVEGKVVKMFSDSRLVVGQVGGELEARDERMQGYLSHVRHLQSKFESFSLLHIPRSGNTC